MQLKILEEKSICRSRNLPQRQRDARSRVYVFHEGETIIENLNKRHYRPYKDYRKLLEDRVIFQGMRWSRTAGCGCGCSPGFILECSPRDSTGAIRDFFITVCAEEDYDAIVAKKSPDFVCRSSEKTA